MLDDDGVPAAAGGSVEVHTDHLAIRDGEDVKARIVGRAHRAPADVEPAVATAAAIEPALPEGDLIARALLPVREAQRERGAHAAEERFTRGGVGKRGRGALQVRQEPSEEIGLGGRGGHGVDAIGPLLQLGAGAARVQVLSKVRLGRAARERGIVDAIGLADALDVLARLTGNEATRDGGGQRDERDEYARIHGSSGRDMRPGVEVRGALCRAPTGAFASPAPVGWRCLPPAR